MNVTCPKADHFRCSSGACVPISYHNDGDPDCADRVDESKSFSLGGGGGGGGKVTIFPSDASYPKYVRIIYLLVKVDLYPSTKLRKSSCSLVLLEGAYTGGPL